MVVDANTWGSRAETTERSDPFDLARGQLISIAAVTEDRRSARARRTHPQPTMSEATPEATEPTLLQRVAAGDPDAVEAVMERYGGLVWSIARRLSASAEDAEDAAQEAFIDLWKHAGRYRPEAGKESTFVGMICRRRCIDRLRKRGRRPKLQGIGEGAMSDPALTSDAQTGLEKLAIEDEAAHVARYLSELKPDARQVLELSVYRGLSHSQISEQLELPLGTVKTHVRRSLIRVRELLARDRKTREVPS